MSDLGNGKFDGAHLIANFEDLNPANTYWIKFYNVYSKVDTEEQRFLNFETLFQRTRGPKFYIIRNGI